MSGLFFLSNRKGNTSSESHIQDDSEEFPGEDVFGFGDDLELNQFDGLPFSSRYYKLLKERKSLPVWKVRSQFKDALEENQLIVVSGTAKTGRSTQIPQWCAELCLSAQYQHGMVVCTQTNKQRAVDLALRVADEMDVNIGHEVGYTIPLETCCSADTVLREMMSDPFLEHYGVVIVDQAHERTVGTDVLLGLLRDILLQRPELRVVVLSVPPMTDKLLKHYRSVPLISLEAPGSAEVVHSYSSNKDYFYSALRLVLEIHRTKEGGDVVVFLASDEVRHPRPEHSKCKYGFIHFSCLLQEVQCAYSILQREGTRLGGDLDQMVPIIMCSSYLGLLPNLAEQAGSAKSRRVFLSTHQEEDVWWPAESVNFVIDTGVQRKMWTSVSLIPVFFLAPSCFLEPPAGSAHEALQCHRKFQHPEGDHFTLINIYNAFKRNLTTEKWCREYFLDYSSLKTADAIRTELTDTLNRIELPISEPSFGTKTNTHNIKRALLAGFFMQIARDVDGSGNYFILAHKHVAQVHPFSSYGAQSHKLGLPEWVVFNEYTLSDNNCMRTVSEISPQV
uniref:DEAD-box helicase OB fold domain-containing protein n=1 Tax=Salarias fasciatus TaxID=181472 RepID=A0A672FLU2_SALFA